MIKKNKHIIFIIIFYSLFVESLFSSDTIVYRVPIQGVIDLGLPTYIERIINEAESNQAEAIIFDIDTFGGTIVTEWYQVNKTSDERIKMAAFILDRELRADGIRVVVYMQKRIGNSWQDSGTDGEMGKQMEELILTRAREIRASGYIETTN